jgi:hypothetical protein
MNRHSRRAAHAKGLDLPTVDVRCGVCGLLFVRLLDPKRVLGKARKAAEEAVARAYRQHCRVAGCVPLKDIQPIELPDAVQPTAPAPSPSDMLVELDIKTRDRLAELGTETRLYGGDAMKVP